ncbi:MAG: class A beta-lactamase [Chthoniobacterales bacterium]|nr:class A beta-lactamase [Chthoniobacterales bacterium]
MNHSPFRHFLLLATLSLFFASACKPLFATPQTISSTSVQKQLADLEASSGGHLGVAAVNTANEKHIEYRAEELFPFCSTFKVMVAAAILKQSMSDPHLLQQKMNYTEQDVDASGYAPITKNHLATGMTISELCSAALCYSDNNAANLLIKKLGGPQAVTSFARSIGNSVFRLDRLEPELNSGIPGDIRDTSTPAAMENSLQKLALGNVLGASQQKQLVTWMTACTTGYNRIRAGVPIGWIVADKTGSGDYGITNDIGILYPLEGAPIVITIFFFQDKKDSPHREDVIAAATRILVDEFTQAKH